MTGFACLVLACLLAASATAGAPSHPLATQTLDGRPFVVPDDLPERASLLVIGFTRDSRTATSAWAREIAQDDVLRRSVDLYQVAMLEDVPLLLRRMVVAGIRRDVPGPLHRRFLLVTQQTGAWKKLVSHAEPDAAYLLLAQGGRIVWRGSGDFSEALLDLLRSAIAGSREAP